MKSLVGLLEYLLHDCGRKCDAPVSRDVKTLRKRIEHEGDSFATITLPAFCSDFERSLADGRIGPGLFLHFVKKKSGMPAFLSGFLSKVFDGDGALSANPSIDCIRAVRQICLFCKKVQRPCSEARVRTAIDRYADCDVYDVVEELPGTQLSRYFKLVASILCADLSLDQPSEGFTSLLDELRPKHGPGATREHISGNQKYVHRVWHDRLREVGFTYLRFGHSSQVVTSHDLECWPVHLDPGAEPPVRVVTVPKTLKTPRIIAVEPVCMQYAQQALQRHLVDRIAKSYLMRGHVNFRDQRVNQMLALAGSKDGFYATIDLSDASDRVSLAHFRALFHASPVFRDMCEACRSMRAELPSGEVLSLSKFASMGSALCFPVESMVFFTSIIASRIKRKGLFPTTSLVHSLGRDVYVYGDDLIVPADEASAICEDLESIGFKVNWRKSFWTGKFRESCGSDCYGGEKVTSVYLRRDLPTSRRDVEGLLSTVATANQLFAAGLTRTAYALRKSVEKLLGNLPVVAVDSPAIGWLECSDIKPRLRSNRELQRAEMHAWVPVTTGHDDPLEDCHALVKCLLLIGQPNKSVDHLSTSPRPYGLALKRRWVPYR